MNVLRRHFVQAGVAVLAGGLVVAFWPRTPETPEDLIRRQVIRMARAAEQQDLSAVLEGISERFRGPESGGRQEVKQLLAAQLFRRNWVRVFVADQQVTLISPTEAEFVGKFVLGGAEATELKTLAQESVVGSYEIKGKLAQEGDGQWRFVTASYRQLAPGQVF